MKREIMVAGVALLALAACSKKTETATASGGAAGGAAASATATAPAASAPPAALAPPSRKAGLWSQTIEASQMKQTTKICLDDTVEKTMKWYGAQNGKSDCTQESVTPRLGGGWAFKSVCSMGDAGTITSQGTATGDFNSHYVVDIDSTTAGSSMPEANGVHKIKIDATWEGPCPADMKPGDMTLPGGMKINMMDAMKGGPAAGHMSHADMEKMRKQAMDMAASMKK